MRRIVVPIVFAVGATIVSLPAAAQPDPNKVLRVAFPVAETGFDPQASNDVYSGYVARAIFDPLYTYDILKRPYTIVPNTAAALPEISADGLTWILRIKPGIYFDDDPVFKGRKRELTAADYIYSWKRTLDPKMRSFWLQTFDGLFEGAPAVVTRAKETGKFDYDAPMAGLEALDRYTIRIRLVHPAYDLLPNLTTVQSAAVAREVIDAYGDASGWAMQNPVGTGPFRLKDWRRGQRIVLEASPGFREVLYPGSDDPADRAIVAKLKGKKLPLLGRIEVSVIEESNPRLLAFEKGDLDYIQVPPDLVPNVLKPDDTLQPRFAKAGVTLGRGIQPAISYTFFNMEDPVVGGYTKDKVALRRAIGMAFNIDEEIKVLWKGQAVPATGPIPPHVVGYDPKFNGHVKYDLAGARALLDRFGYIDRDGDGFREQPDGKPLVLDMGSVPDARGRQYQELWTKTLTSLGLRAEFRNQKWPDLLKMARAGKLQMWYLGNINTTTDGYGFLGLLYGGHAGLSNISRFNLPEYNKLYDQSRSMPDSPERTKLFREMSALVTAYAPLNLEVYRYENLVVYPWVIGYKYNAFSAHPWMYYDLDLKMPHRSVAP